MPPLFWVLVWRLFSVVLQWLLVLLQRLVVFLVQSLLVVLVQPQPLVQFVSKPGEWNLRLLARRLRLQRLRLRSFPEQLRMLL